MTSAHITELRSLATDKALTRQRAQEAITELCDALQAIKKRRERQATFTLSDVMAEAEKRHWKPGAAETFFDHYEMVGWVYGKCRHPIVKLAAAMSTWERTAKNGNSPVNGKTENIGNRYGVG